MVIVSLNYSSNLVNLFNDVRVMQGKMDLLGAMERKENRYVKPLSQSPLIIICHLSYQWLKFCFSFFICALLTKVDL